jgi:hypothetical protein
MSCCARSDDVTKSHANSRLQLYLEIDAYLIVSTHQPTTASIATLPCFSSASLYEFRVSAFCNAHTQRDVG